MDSEDRGPAMCPCTHVKGVTHAAAGTRGGRRLDWRGRFTFATTPSKKRLKK